MFNKYFDFTIYYFCLLRKTLITYKNISDWYFIFEVKIIFSVEYTQNSYNFYLYNYIITINRVGIDYVINSNKLDEYEGVLPTNLCN